MRTEVKMKYFILHLRIFLLVLWSLLRGGDGYNCPYGHHCSFEPAPPGRVPPCAQPGLTYCQHPDSYPETIIRQLVEAGQYDIRTLLSDESTDDFGAKKNDYPYSYGPNSLPHVDQISLVNDPIYTKSYHNKFHNGFGHDIYSHKTPLQPPSPVDPSPYNINAYQASQNISKFGFQGYNPGTYWVPSVNQFNGDYEKKVFRQTNVVSPNTAVYNQNFFNPNYDSSNWFRQAPAVTQYNPKEWWKYISPARSDVNIERSLSYSPRQPQATAARRKRNAELVRESAKRPLTGAEALRIALGLANEESSAERPRRQAGGGGEALCRARTSYVTPRAALNNKGSWRYVVNMPANMTQLVRAEICAATECSGLCTLPLGYTSSCEQKYIQKRLVALEANGQTLYTDLFWIPSCCQCTIRSTN